MNESSPESREGTDDPTDDGTFAGEGDLVDSEFVMSIDQRKLLWAVVGLLAILLVAEGVALLALRARVQDLAMVRGSGYPASFGNQEGVGGGGPSVPYSQAPPEGGPVAPLEPPPNSGNTEAGPPVMGDEVRAQVAAFIEEQDLEAAVAGELTDLMKETDASLTDCAQRLTRGEIDAEEFATSRDQALERHQVEITRLLGWELAASLQQRLDPTAAAPAQ
jgi:hypothetical protein